MKRLITGNLKGSDDLPIANRKIIFIRDTGSYTTASQYVSDVIEAYTDINGVLLSKYQGMEAGGVWLWTNEIGELPTQYNCIMGTGSGDAFTFTLPPASMPITLSEVRQNSQPIPAPTYNTLINYVDNAIAGVVAGESKNLFSDDLTAVSTLSALRIIDIGTRNYASNDNINHAFKSMGFTTGSVNNGDIFKVITEGVFTDSSWNWQLDKPLF
jgi:hypothetical protein